ncbi:hypothetical protein [Paraburkholderia terricola]|uniref:Uncharacterized protein n=1 Tax=Paraburkholderia terricola TaxID=169427 RepID=A0ABU1LX77_9BURK|nr:hypothetical protein [Paraburkholderia terricola]MDR6411366.1 hypothetical protein [Paraburkholderia terricola]MDR6483394.1 hypothetical protein [Paraburkholderia terricola]
MTKASGRKGSQRTTPPARLRMFRTISWYRTLCTPASEYISHILRELGRLGMDIRDIESLDRAPHTKAVLSDLISWIGEPPSDAFSKLFDWKTLDLSQMESRLEKNSSAKPRIELSAHVTKMNNLSVRWHPGGWKDSHFDWNGTGQNHFNLVSQRKWQEPPDFCWFVGDEQPTFDGRASNELMYVRGVGNLRPEPHENYGPYATYNADVVDSILICAVRSAYEGLIERLKYSFEVDVVDAFDFVIRDETDEDVPHSSQFPIHRVVAWSLEDAGELRIRREQEAAAEQEKKDRSDLANITLSYGFTLEVFVDVLIRASSTRSTGSGPSDEVANRKAAKDLRNAGFNVNAGHVRHVRQLIERYNPEILPEALRPVTAPEDKGSLGKIVDIASFR